MVPEVGTSGITHEEMSSPESPFQNANVNNTAIPTAARMAFIKEINDNKF